MTRARVVVGIDGSRTAERAMLWAAEVAGRRGAQLLIVHASDPVPRTSNAQPTDFVRTLMLEAQTAVYESGANCEVALLWADEQPVRLLIRLSKQAELLVVGSHGLGQLAGKALGSVAYRVTAHARCPVAVVPGAWEPAGLARPVVVGVLATVDGSNALGYAFAEAASRGCELKAVRSWCRADWVPELSDGAQGWTDRFEAKQADRAEVILRPFRQEQPDVRVTTIVTGDPVEDALLAAAADADQLVVGCKFRDRHRLSRLDWATSRLVHDAPCPVIVVGGSRSRRIEQQAVRAR